MSKKQLLQSLSFGYGVAESEHELKKYFVETLEWRKVFDDSCDIVYGPKGSGKSAIYSLLDDRAGELLDRRIIYIAAEKPRGATAFQQLVSDPPSSETEFKSVWKLYLLSLIAENFETLGVDTSESKKLIEYMRGAGLLPQKGTLAEKAKAIFQFVKRWFRPESFEPTYEVEAATGNQKLSAKIKFDTLSDAEKEQGFTSLERLFEMANEALQHDDYSVWIAIDRLDVAFVESETLESNALRSLFHVYLDLQSFERLKVKIFLRSDIWERLTSSKFPEASHIRRKVNITWERDTLLNLIMRRFLQSKGLAAYYNIESKLVLDSLEEQTKLFYRIFPDQIDVGSRKLKTLDWILSRTKDGTGQSAPREVIELLNQSKEMQLQEFAVGKDEPVNETLFSRQAIKSALAPVSKIRLEQTLFAEYPDMKAYVKALENQKANQTSESLDKLWRTSEVEGEKIREKLIQIGFFERQEKKGRKLLVVPFLYRPVLDLVQGTVDTVTSDEDDE